MHRFHHLDPAGRRDPSYWSVVSQVLRDRRVPEGRETEEQVSVAIELAEVRLRFPTLH